MLYVRRLKRRKMWWRRLMASCIAPGVGRSGWLTAARLASECWMSAASEHRECECHVTHILSGSRRMHVCLVAGPDDGVAGRAARRFDSAHSGTGLRATWQSAVGARLGSTHVMRDPSEKCMRDCSIQTGPSRAELRD